MFVSVMAWFDPVVLGHNKIGQSYWVALGFQVDPLLVLCLLIIVTVDARKYWPVGRSTQL